MEKSNASVYLRRRDRLRRRLQEKKADAYATFDASDVAYLSGFPSEGCFVLVGPREDAIFSPLLLADHVRSVVGRDSLRVVEDRALLQAMAGWMKKSRARKAGYDPEKVTVGLFQALSSFKGVSWTPLPHFVLAQRMVKDESEAALIRRACRITHQAQERCFLSLEKGLDEEGTAHRLEAMFREGGAPKPAFETIVAFQENSAFPHHLSGRKRLRSNNAVLMDLGCSLSGYKSDLTRTGFFGKMTPKFRKIYDIVKQSQAAGIAEVRPGVSAGQVDFVCRELIRRAGYGDRFIHGTGHGVGLDIHEPPRLGIGSKEILEEGMVVTVEPGIYLPGEFGVRIEDTVLVTRGGCEILTK